MAAWERTLLVALVVHVQAHRMCRVYPLHQRTEEDHQLDLFQEWFLFPLELAGLPVE